MKCGDGRADGGGMWRDGGMEEGGGRNRWVVKKDRGVDGRIERC